MSGVSGSNRIERKIFKQVLNDYTENVLKKLPGFKSVEISGSFNSDTSKQDFGDMDLIVHFDTELNKSDLKKELVKYFEKQPDNIIVPFTSDKYKGKKYYNSGEIVTINYPQGNGLTVQIDNIIALDQKELDFKKNFLDMPAEKQGLVLGLIKITMMEIEPEIIAKKMGISLPKLEDKEEYEFNLSSVEIQLRAVKYEEIDGKIKQVSKRVVWESKDWDYISKILFKYNLDDSFEGLVQQAQKIIENKRGLQRIVGVFKSMITVKSGEVGTPKGINKEKAIARIEGILEGKPNIIINFKKYLNEKNNTVGLFVGRFQPLTKAHTDIINTISKENSKGIIFLVKGVKTSELENNPFDTIIQKKLLEEVIPSNIEIVILPSAFFVDYIKELPDNDFVIYAGSDRINSYEKFSKYLEDGKTLIAKEIKRTDDDISATKVRTALKENNLEEFKKLTDNRIHKYFKELQGYMK